MELFLTIVITLAIIVIAVKYGDVINSLFLVFFWGTILLIMTGIVGLFVWTFIHGALN